MTERLIPKLDRLGAKAGIKQMTPEMHNFAMLVRADVVAHWPERPWVGLTDKDRLQILDATEGNERGFVMKLVEDKLKEKNT
jgi:hypothetical protein